jgi:hypothetical protein
MVEIDLFLIVSKSIFCLREINFQAPNAIKHRNIGNKMNIKS